MADTTSIRDGWDAICDAAVERLRQGVQGLSLTPSQAVIAAAIAGHRDFRRDGRVLLSYEELHTIAGPKAVTVKRAVPRFKDLGLYVVETRPTADGRKNLYMPGRWFSEGDVSWRRTPKSAPGRSTVAAPGGRHMLLLQRWGASPEQARALVERLVEAAGPIRRAHLDQLFAKMEGRWRWEGPRRVAWLRSEAARVARHPLYWPADRAPRSRTVSDTVIDAIRAAGGRATKTELIEATGKTAASVADQTVAMVRAGLIVRVAPGEFVLPGRRAAEDYVTSRTAIVDALLGRSGYRATVDELVGATGKSRNAIYSSASRMVDAGELVRLRRGVFALPPQRVSANTRRARLAGRRS